MFFKNTTTKKNQMLKPLKDTGKTGCDRHKPDE